MCVQEIEAYDRRPCSNPNCRDGWDMSHPARPRCCPSCDGRGYHAGVRDNRRYYQEMCSLVAVLAFEGHLRAAVNESADEVADPATRDLSAASVA